MPVTGMAVPESWDVTGNSFFDQIHRRQPSVDVVTGDRVEFANRYGGDGLSNDIVYYVVSPTTRTTRHSSWP